MNDIVHLNSGSPDLKVTATDSDKVTVEWPDDLGQMQEMTLPEVCFQKN